MKRCHCLLYKELQHLRRESSVWIYDDQYGLIALDCIYPLVDFDKGNAVQICPYYLYLKDGIRISSAFFRRKDLQAKELELIIEAVDECKNSVWIDRYIEHRHAEVLTLIAKKKGLTVGRKLFDVFYDFIQVRSKYLDITPCLMIPPIDHKDRMTCINECWLGAFDKYLKERT